MAAAGTTVQPDLLRTLVSLSRSLPDAVVVLLVNRTEADILIPLVSQPPMPPPTATPTATGTAGGNRSGVTEPPPAPAAAAGPRLRLHLRLYHWAWLEQRLPPHVRPRSASIKRFNAYPSVLDDLAAGGKLERDHPEAVFFSNVPRALLRRPDGVMLSDGRDVVFQRDPFEEMWARAAAAAVASAAAVGRPRESVPGGAVGGWAPGLQGFSYLLSAQEPDMATVGSEDWNRSWVHYCFFYLGEALVNAKHILCAGTTLGTVEGVYAYLQRGMVPGFETCNDLFWEKSMDQGIHNVLLGGYNASEWAAVVSGHQDDRYTGQRKARLLSLVRGVQSALTVERARYEDGLICTMALAIDRERMTRDEAGFVTKWGDATARCAVVHQIDRQRALYDFYTRTYALP